MARRSPKRLPEPEVLFCCYNKWVVVALSDSPEDMQARVRNSIPAREKPAHHGAEKPFPEHVGRVAWSEKRQVHWFAMAGHPTRPYLLDPSYIAPELLGRIPRAEPKKAPSEGHTAAKPFVGKQSKAAVR